MKPDRTNYEIWLIDYLDGNLDGIKAKQLISFLEENPDIREECSDILTYSIRSETGTFKHKDNLKRSISDLNENQFEYLCISAAENDITLQQRNELDAIVRDNPEKKKTFEIFKRLKLIAPVVTYNRKPVLKRLTTTQKIVRLSALGLSAAAGIAIMISLFNLLPEKSITAPSLISSNTMGDAVIKKNQPNSIIVNDPRADKELRKHDIKEITVSPVKNVVGEVETSSSLVISENREVNIEKIGFIEGVNLIEGGNSGSLIAINTDDGFPVANPEKPGFNEFIAKTFRERVLKSKTPETGSLKVYEIADAGINGINKLLGWDMSLQKTRDEKGELKSLYFSSKILKFNAPVKKVQPGS